MQLERIDKAIATHRSFVKGDAGDIGNGQSGGLRTAGYWKEDRPDLPLFSVITVVRNDAAHIAETILSVIHQDWGNVELIVIDGGSDDGTVEVLKTYEPYIDHWASSPDGGTYDAMNKGLVLARGRYVHFLNSGDYFTSQNVLSIAARAFSDSGKRWLHGNILMLDRRSGRGWLRYSDVSRYYYLFKGIPQQAFFFERSLYKESGNFDLQYPVVADLDFLLRVMIKYKIPGKYLDIPVAVFDTAGISGDMKKKEAERNSVLRKYYPRWAFIFIKNDFFRSQLVKNEARKRRKSILEMFLSRF
jgi:glycosyltransferase involved in cell wall biosynthesis